MEQETPDHVVIGDFINKYIVPYKYEIFTMITKAIIEELNINITNQYDDGTKIEANANKYKFVWKPITYHKKLDIKIKKLLLIMDVQFNSQKLIKSYELNEIIKEYIEKENIDIKTIPIGKGKRLTKNQKNYKLAYQYLVKLLEYEEKEEICGENEIHIIKQIKMQLQWY